MLYNCNIKIERRLKWFGHVGRLPPDYDCSHILDMAKRLEKKKKENKKKEMNKNKKKRTRWIDDVKRNLKMVGL